MAGRAHFSSGCLLDLPRFFCRSRRRQERLWEWRDNQIVRSATACPVLLPYRLAWSFVTHGGWIDEQLLNKEKYKLW